MATPVARTNTASSSRSSSLFNLSMAEDKIEWKSTPLNKDACVKAISSADRNAVENIVEAIPDKFRNHTKFWYFTSADGSFVKVVVSQNKPSPDMSLSRARPALGVIEYKTKADGAKITSKWNDLGNQVKKSLESQDEKSEGQGKDNGDS